EAITMEDRFFLRATPTIVARYSGTSALLILDLDQIQSPQVKIYLLTFCDAKSRPGNGTKRRPRAVFHRIAEDCSKNVPSDARTSKQSHSAPLAMWFKSN